MKKGKQMEDENKIEENKIEVEHEQSLMKVVGKKVWRGVFFSVVI